MFSMRIKRLARIVSLCAIAACVAKGAFSFLRFHFVQRDFDQVELGQSTDAVTRLLGHPNYHSGVCLPDMESSSECTSELVYSHPFAPLIPEYFVVDFSADGKVISADHLDSP
jgi:hypothetical protein